MQTPFKSRIGERCGGVYTSIVQGETVIHGISLFIVIKKHLLMGSLRWEFCFEMQSRTILLFATAAFCCSVPLHSGEMDGCAVLGD